MVGTKRSAPSSSASRKKTIVSKNKAISVSSSKKSTSAAPKRKQPLTAIANENNDEDSADENGEWDIPDEMEVDEDEDEEPSPKTPAAAAPSNGQSNAESRKVQREVQRARAAAKPNADLLREAKNHWDLARQKNLSQAERQKHVKDLMGVVKGKIQDLVFKHDASRVVQTIFKCGTAQERDAAAAELKGKYRDLSTSKYAKHLVTKVLRYCPSHRSTVISELHPHALRLVLHKESSPIIADAYELYASAPDRDLLLSSFYGKEVELFEKERVAKAALSGSKDSDSKKPGKRGLEAVLESADTERRKRILSALKDNLLNIFNNPDKGAVDHAITHRALWEYLSAINTLPEFSEEDREKRRREIFDSCQELVASMAHTREGARSVREFLAQGNAKDRKQIIKMIKPHVQRFCENDIAQTVLFTAMDVVDDTKLLSKSIISDIVAPSLLSAFILPSSNNNSSSSSSSAGAVGRRTLLYILAPRSSRHFPPALTALLAETDAARSKTSKKDDNIRAREIRTAASPALLAFVASNAEDMLRDPPASILLVEILLCASLEGDKASMQKALDAVLEPLSKTYPTPVPSNGELTHVVDVPHSSRVYKTLLQGGHFEKASGGIAARVDGASFEPIEFARGFVKSAGNEGLVKMAGPEGNGQFVVTELVKRVREDGTPEERKELKGVLGKVVGDIKKKLRSAGAEKDGSGKRGLDVLLAELDQL